MNYINIVTFMLFIFYLVICYFLKSIFTTKRTKKITSWIPFYNNVELAKIVEKTMLGWIILVCEILLIVAIETIPSLYYIQTMLCIVIVILNIFVSNSIIKKEQPEKSKVLCIINIVTLGIFYPIIINTMKNLKLTIILIVGIILFLIAGKDELQYETDRDKKYTSPNGTNTITVKYDYLSRPSVYKGNKKIFSYNGPGYMESVYFDVEWVSEDELILKATNNKYKNDVYTIHIK